MNQRNVFLLEQSIEAWKKKLEVGLESILGPEACPLCKEYWSSDWSASCKGCPIAILGYKRCIGTPYNDAEEAWDDENKKRFAETCAKEIAFLEEVLSKNKTTDWRNSSTKTEDGYNG
jgi:hypothetical protein